MIEKLINTNKFSKEELVYLEAIYADLAKESKKKASLRVIEEAIEIANTRNKNKQEIKIGLVKVEITDKKVISEEVEYSEKISNIDSVYVQDLLEENKELFKDIPADRYITIYSNYSEEV